MNPFHLAIPVSDLTKCRRFYKEGRSDTKWVDFNFFGHQLVIHQKPENSSIEEQTNNVDLGTNQCVINGRIASLRSQ